MLGDASLELGHDGSVTTESQHRLESPLEGLEAKLLETRDLPLSEVREGELDQSRAAPERQRSLERLERRLRVVLKRAPRLGGERLEPMGVDRLRRNAQCVSRRLRDEYALRAEHATQVRHVA